MIQSQPLRRDSKFDNTSYEARMREFQSCMNELVCLQIVKKENVSEDEEEDDLLSSAFDHYSQEMLRSVEDVKNCLQADNP